MAIQAGQDVGRYHIIEALGQGGMATVYKAYDTRLERDVAIKLIRVDIIGPAQMGEMLKRFEREGKALAKFLHPNVVPVLDFGEHEGVPYLVMAYLPGGTLKALIGKPMPYAEAARLLAPVARALEYAHEKNIIHRDVKPTNILLTEKGVPMLSDFGLAKMLGMEETTQLTGSGVGVGTPEYMAPEQWEGKAVPQTDIYALGVVLYELVIGRKPYTADTPASVLIKQLTEPLPKPRSFVPDLPEEVEQVLCKALAKEVANRYDTMAEFAAVLERLGSQTSTPSSLAPIVEPLTHRETEIQPQPSAWYQSSPPALLPLVGRTAEWQTIQSLWETTSGGNSRMLLICGEAGIGKTRLSEELVNWTAHQGVRTAVAHCYPSEGALSYAPVIEWLRSSRLPPLDRVWLIELSRLLPELLKDNSSPPAPLTEAWQRLRLFEALARAILGARQKTLLLIEDLHWCDRDTLEWLHYLLRFDPHAPLMVVGTVRSEATAANPAYDQLLSALRQEGNALEIELGRLNEAETNELAAQVAGKKMEHKIGSMLYLETEGNPLFTVEMVRAELFKQTHLPDEQSLPYKAHAVLENRIRQLSQATRELVLLAATIGRAFPLEVLRQASGATEADLIKSLDEMLHQRIVREIARNTFDFSHDKLREAAFAGASGAHRQLLHRQVAEALVKLENKDLEARSGEIASHYEQAGNTGLAVQYYRMAAESVRKIFANEQAIQFYQRAISLGESPLPDSSTRVVPPDQLAQLHEKLGEVLTLAGKYPQAQASFERALAQPFSFQALWRAQIHCKISEALMQQHQYAQAHVALDQAEQTLNLPIGGGTLPERQEWMQIQIARSELFYWGNHPDQMDAIIQKILPMVEVEGRPDQQVVLLSQQLGARLRHERYRLSDETVEIARRNLELANTFDVPYDIAWGQFHMGFCLLWHGEPAAARQWLVNAYEAAVRMGARLLQVRSLTYLSIVNRQTGDAISLREQSLQVFELASAVGEVAYQGISLANQGWLAWRDGDIASAEQLCNSANEIWNKSGGFMFTWLAEWVLLAIAVSRSDLAQAENHALALLDPNPFHQPILDPIALKLNEALRASQAQDAGAALQLFDQALEMVKASGDL